MVPKKMCLVVSVGIIHELIRLKEFLRLINASLCRLPRQEVFHLSRFQCSRYLVSLHFDVVNLSVLNPAVSFNLGSRIVGTPSRQSEEGGKAVLQFWILLFDTLLICSN